MGQYEYYLYQNFLRQRRGEPPFPQLQCWIDRSKAFKAKTRSPQRWPTSDTVDAAKTDEDKSSDSLRPSLGSTGPAGRATSDGANDQLDESTTTTNAKEKNPYENISEVVERAADDATRHSTPAEQVPATPIEQVPVPIGAHPLPTTKPGSTTTTELCSKWYSLASNLTSMDLMD